MKLYSKILRRAINTNRLARDLKKKNKIINEFKEDLGSNWQRFEKQVNIKFPQYYPPFRTFKVTDGKIFVYTHRKEKGRRQMYIFDFQGKLLKLGTIISGYPGVIYKNFYYYLKENEDTEIWELHREKVF